MTNGANGSQQMALNWTDPGSNGLTYHVEIKIDAGAWQAVQGSGTRTVGAGFSEPHSICARTVDSQGRIGGGDGNCAQGRTGAANQASLSAARGSAVARLGCDSAACAYIVLHIRNAAPNTVFQAQCQATAGSQTDWDTTDRNGNPLRTDDTGNYDGELNCVFGDPGAQVWVQTDQWGNTAPITW